jgi:hypothetical protein
MTNEFPPTFPPAFESAFPPPVGEPIQTSDAAAEPSPRRGRRFAAGLMMGAAVVVGAGAGAGAVMLVSGADDAGTNTVLPTSVAQSDGSEDQIGLPSDAFPRGGDHHGRGMPSNGSGAVPSMPSSDGAQGQSAGS